MGETVSEERLAEMGIVVEHVGAGLRQKTGGVYKTLGWIRPRLSGGEAVLAVEWSEHDDAWVPVDRKKVHPAFGPMEPGGD